MSIAKAVCYNGFAGEKRFLLGNKSALNIEKEDVLMKRNTKRLAALLSLLLAILLLAACAGLAGYTGRKRRKMSEISDLDKKVFFMYNMFSIENFFRKKKTY